MGEDDGGAVGPHLAGSTLLTATNSHPIMEAAAGGN